MYKRQGVRRGVHAKLSPDALDLKLKSLGYPTKGRLHEARFLNPGLERKPPSSLLELTLFAEESTTTNLPSGAREICPSLLVPPR